MTSSPGSFRRLLLAPLPSFLLSVLLAFPLAGCSKHGGDSTQGAAGLAGVSSADDPGPGRSGASGTSGTDNSGSSTNALPAEGGQAGTGMAAATGVAIDDTIITTRLKTALLADTSLKGAQISVNTRHGEVVMTGTVASAAQKEHAARVAQALTGVKAVNNKLALAK